MKKYINVITFCMLGIYIWSSLLIITFKLKFIFTDTKKCRWLLIMNMTQNIMQPQVAQLDNKVEGEALWLPEGRAS